MSDLTVVTPPDKYITTNCSILLVCPSMFIKQSFQNLVEEFDHSFTLYIIEDDEIGNYGLPDRDLVSWLLYHARIADFVILDLDNMSSLTRKFESLILSNGNSYWLTKAEDSLYNIININKIYDLDSIKTKIGEKIVKATLG